MDVADIDTLINKLQELKAKYGKDACWRMAAHDLLGSDRYGIGYGLIVGDRETLENFEEISNDKFKDNVSVVASAYEFCGCLG